MLVPGQPPNASTPGLRPHFNKLMFCPGLYNQSLTCMADNVLEHLPDPQRALAEMVRVLMAGGMVFNLSHATLQIFRTLSNFLWRNNAITDKQGVAWLARLQLVRFRIPIGFSSAPCGWLATRLLARTLAPMISQIEKVPSYTSKIEWFVLGLILVYCQAAFLAG